MLGAHEGDFATLGASVAEARLAGLSWHWLAAALGCGPFRSATAPGWGQEMAAAHPTHPSSFDGHHFSNAQMVLPLPTLGTCGARSALLRLALVGK